MMRPQIYLAAAVVTLSQLVQGQTYTSCDPLTNTTCPSDAALGKTITVDFTQGASSEFSLESGTEITYGDDGAEFIITSAGLARTIISNKYIFFGKVEVFLKAAAGTGIVSSFVMESDDLDEIDLEWLGGNTTVVETNYFGKGNTTTYDRATYVPVSTPQTTFHNYTIDWTRTSIQWYVDSVLVRTLPYASALSGKNYPQTPMQIKIGNWVGGGAGESTGTVEWAGGYTNLDDAPFTMYVKNLTITDYESCAESYTYGDETGDYGSIVVAYNSTMNATGSCASTSTETLGSSSSSSGTSSTFKSSGNSTSESGSGSASASSTSSSSSASTILVSGTRSLVVMLFGFGLRFLYL